MKKSIVKTTIIYISIIFFITISSSFMILYVLLKTQMDKILDDTSSVVSSIIVNSITHLMLQGNSAEVCKVIGEEAKTFSLKRIYIVRNGRVVCDSLEMDRKGNPVDGEIMASIIEKGRYLSGNGGIFYDKVTPILNRQECAGCHGTGEKIIAHLITQIDVGSFFHKVWIIKNYIILIIVISLLVTSVLVFLLLNRYIRRPMEYLLSKMREVEKGDLQARSELKTGDEMEKLSSGFNNMVQKLDTTMKELVEYQEEKIKRVDRLITLGEISAGIAHEIKNPLAGISSTVQVLAKEINDDRKWVVNEIINEVNRLNKIINDFLEFARPSKPKIAECDIGEIIDRVVFLVNDGLNKKNISVRQDISDDSRKIHADYEQVKQVFLNIILNAIHFMGDGGELEIKSYSSKTGSVTVEIKDNGIGINEEDINRIFVPFYTTKKDGSGLGLSVVYSIVDAHRGNIYVKSEKGKGTTFYVSLPRNPS